MKPSRSPKAGISAAAVYDEEELDKMIEKVKAYRQGKTYVQLAEKIGYKGKTAADRISKFLKKDLGEGIMLAIFTRFQTFFENGRPIPLRSSKVDTSDAVYDEEEIDKMIEKVKDYGRDKSHEQLAEEIGYKRSSATAILKFLKKTLSESNMLAICTRFQTLFKSGCPMPLSPHKADRPLRTPKVDTSAVVYDEEEIDKMIEKVKDYGRDKSYKQLAEEIGFKRSSATAIPKFLKKTLPESNMLGFFTRFQTLFNSGCAVPLSSPKAVVSDAVPLSSPKAVVSDAVPLSSPKAVVSDAVPLSSPKAVVSDAVYDEEEIDKMIEKVKDYGRDKSYKQLAEEIGYKGSSATAISRFLKKTLPESNMLAIFTRFRNFFKSGCPMLLSYHKADRPLRTPKVDTSAAVYDEEEIDKMIEKVKDYGRDKSYKQLAEEIGFKGSSATAISRFLKKTLPESNMLATFTRFRTFFKSGRAVSLPSPKTDTSAAVTKKKEGQLDEKNFYNPRGHTTFSTATLNVTNKIKVVAADLEARRVRRRGPRTSKVYLIVDEHRTGRYVGMSWDVKQRLSKHSFMSDVKGLERLNTWIASQPFLDAFVLFEGTRAESSIVEALMINLGAELGWDLLNVFNPKGLISTVEKRGVSDGEYIMAGTFPFKKHDDGHDAFVEDIRNMIEKAMEKAPIRCTRVMRRRPKKRNSDDKELGNGELPRKHRRGDSDSAADDGEGDWSKDAIVGQDEM